MQPDRAIEFLPCLTGFPETLVADIVPIWWAEARIRHLRSDELLDPAHPLHRRTLSAIRTVCADKPWKDDVRLEPAIWDEAAFLQEHTEPRLPENLLNFGMDL